MTPRIPVLLLLLCSLASAKEIELDGRTAKPLPLTLVAQIRSDIGSACDLPGDDVKFSKLFRTGTFVAGRHHRVLIVQASPYCLCSATGNCEFWVFERTQKGYRQLLHKEDVQTFKFLPISSNGFRDLQTSMHASAFYSDLTVYRFDGQQYTLDRCFSRSYHDENGRDLKKPAIAENFCP